MLKKLYNWLTNKDELKRLENLGLIPCECSQFEAREIIKTLAAPVSPTMIICNNCGRIPPEE